MLIDFDSILYTSVYKIVSISQMREALTNYTKVEAREWLMQEIYNEGINRCENEILKIQNYIEDIFPVEIKDIQLYITTCKRNFRNEIDPKYKKNRKRNKYVWMLREHYKHNGAKFHDVLEADDLISIDARRLGIGNYLIASIDKDLKQIGGYYWSYYKMRSKDHEGNPIKNEYGFFETEYRQKEVSFISKREADLFLWSQMLIAVSYTHLTLPTIYSV